MHSWQKEIHTAELGPPDPWSRLLQIQMLGENVSNLYPVTSAVISVCAVNIIVMFVLCWTLALKFADASKPSLPSKKLHKITTEQADASIPL